MYNTYLYWIQGPFSILQNGFCQFDYKFICDISTDFWYRPVVKHVKWLIKVHSLHWISTANLRWNDFIWRQIWRQMGWRIDQCLFPSMSSSFTDIFINDVKLLYWLNMTPQKRVDEWFLWKKVFRLKIGCKFQTVLTMLRFSPKLRPPPILTLCLCQIMENVYR